MKKEMEVVIGAGFEGGSVTLWGRRTSGGSWEFAIGRDESTLADFLSEEDEDLIPLLVTEPKTWLTSFDEGMSLFERYSWRRAYPCEVHPDFRHLIWEHVLKNRPPARMLQRWAKACGVDLDIRPVMLADWILGSKRTVVLSGAGLSVPSGVPDFRSSSGWWNSIDPTTVATVDALQKNYDTFHAFYSHRIRGLEGLVPNVGHRILAKWESLGLIQAHGTQNVDGFNQMAGQRNVFELHGSIRSALCCQCGTEASIEEFVDKSACQKCGGRLRPNVTLFDEFLPSEAWEATHQEIAQSDLVIVIGTSLNVYPVNTLPSMTEGRTVVINLDSTMMDHKFDLVINGNLEEVLPQVDELVETSYILVRGKMVSLVELRSNVDSSINEEDSF